MKKLTVLLAVCVLANTACFAQNDIGKKIAQALGVANKKAQAENTAQKTQKVVLAQHLKEYNQNGKLVFTVRIPFTEINEIQSKQPIPLKDKKGKEYYSDRPDYETVTDVFITFKTLVCYGIFTQNDGKALLDKRCNEIINNVIEQKEGIEDIKFDLKNLGSYSFNANNGYENEPFFYQSNKMPASRFENYFGYTSVWIPLGPNGEVGKALKAVKVPTLKAEEIEKIFKNFPAPKVYETGHTSYLH